MDSEARSEGLSGKRPGENVEDGELGVPLLKKARIGGGLVGNVKKVAEIVMVLAAVVRMRGGRNPTAAEKEMVAEAREKLAALCQEFAPKDVFPRDGFRSVIEDLGLNKLREQKLGFRPLKMSIAETLLFTKRKMEKSEELSSCSAAHSSHHLQTNMGAAAENHGPSHTPRKYKFDKPGHSPISSGDFQKGSPLGRVSATNSTSLPYQLPASEVRTSIVSSGQPTSLLGRDSSSPALPKVERPNGSSYTLRIQANSSGHHTLQKTPTWSQQSLSALSGKTGPDNKELPHPPAKVEGTVKVEGTANRTTSRLIPQAATSKPLVTQTTTGHLLSMHQHVQGMNFIQAPSLSNAHSEIGKIVQKFLQPQLPKHPTWTPPSREYMNKALTCQVCKLIINEVENVLICDACEKGYHLKCLQSHNEKAIPRGEWHCVKCLSLSNGKPIPPKYGRVTRNINAPKVSSYTVAVHSSSEKQVETLGEKEKQQKMTVSGSSDLERAPAGSKINNHNPSVSGSNMPNAREMQGDDMLSVTEKMDDKHHVETSPNDVIRISGSACVSSAAGSSVGRPFEEKLVSELRKSPAKPSDTVTKMLDHLQASSNPQYNDQQGISNAAGIPSKQCNDNNLTVKDSAKSDISNGDVGVKQEEQGVVRPEPVEASGTGILASEHARSLSDRPNDVDWVGDIVQVVDGKTHYPSCSVNGVVYKVQDYALFPSSNDKLKPSKLQAMWEDNKTRSKWVIINQCYFPCDLPETVGHPCSPESNEVYESNHGSAIVAGLIRGPCEVLPPGKFIEEIERRSSLGSEANDGLWPLFLCKWIYDESRGVFRDVSSL